MPKVLTAGGDVKIGAYSFPDRKKPCLCIETGNKIVCYGTFNSIIAADAFMNKLGELVGAIFEEGER
jgi:hypothetical protein